MGVRNADTLKRDFEMVRGSMMSEKNIAALRRLFTTAKLYEKEHRLHQIAAARVALLEKEARRASD